MTEEKTLAPEEAPKAYNKAFKQETFTSKRGNDYLFTYVGTKYVLKNVIAPASVPGGRDQSILHNKLIEHVLEGDYGWDYWDKKLSNGKKSDSIEVPDHDCTKVTYNFKFPGFQVIDEISKDSVDANGDFDVVAYWEQLMKRVIQNEEVDFDYWDTHDGINTVMSAADEFIGEAVADSEFAEVMDAAEAFVDKYFH